MTVALSYSCVSMAAGGIFFVFVDDVYTICERGEKAHLNCDLASWPKRLAGLTQEYSWYVPEQGGSDTSSRHVLLFLRR